MTEYFRTVLYVIHHQSTVNEVGKQASTIRCHPWRFWAARRISLIADGVSMLMSLAM